MKNSKIIVNIVLLVFGFGAGFLVGYKPRNYQQNKLREAFTANGQNGNAQRFIGTRAGSQNNSGMMGRGGAVTGSIISIDSNSMTVKLSDGSTKIVLFSASTTYENIVTAQASDIKVGGEVAIFGTINSDGSMTATSVQINPQFARMMASPAPVSK